jgi:hypothetical protein
MVCILVEKTFPSFHFTGKYTFYAQKRQRVSKVRNQSNKLSDINKLNSTQAIYFSIYTVHIHMIVHRRRWIIYTTNRVYIIYSMYRMYAHTTRDTRCNILQKRGPHTILDNTNYRTSPHCISSIRTFKAISLRRVQSSIPGNTCKGLSGYSSRGYCGRFSNRWLASRLAAGLPCWLPRGLSSGGTSRLSTRLPAGLPRRLSCWLTGWLRRRLTRRPTWERTWLCRGLCAGLRRRATHRLSARL